MLDGQTEPRGAVRRLSSVCWRAVKAGWEALGGLPRGGGQALQGLWHRVRAGKKVNICALMGAEGLDSCCSTYTNPRLRPQGLGMAGRPGGKARRAARGGGGGGGATGGAEGVGCSRRGGPRG